VGTTPTPALSQDISRIPGVGEWRRRPDAVLRREQLRQRRGVQPHDGSKRFGGRANLSLHPRKTLDINTDLGS
jgi:hypothetical protein